MRWCFGGCMLTQLSAPVCFFAKPKPRGFIFLHLFPSAGGDFYALVFSDAVRSVRFFCASVDAAG